MINIVKSILNNIIKDIDAGNSNITEEDEAKILEVLNKYTHKDEKLSKYQACQYLNVSRATFDNYIRDGKLPKGIKQVGFKELSWFKKDLDIFINSCK